MRPLAWFVDLMPVLPLLVKVKTKGPRGTLLRALLDTPSLAGKCVEFVVVFDREDDDLLSWRCCWDGLPSGGIEDISRTDSLSEADERSSSPMMSRLSVTLTK
jgi:hypothetical protein